MQKFVFELVLSVAVGAAWVATIGGAYLAFKYVLPYGVIAAICAGTLGLIPGFAVIVCMETSKLCFEIAQEQKKQTILIEKLLEKFTEKFTEKLTDEPEKSSEKSPAKSPEKFTEKPQETVEKISDH